MWLVKAETNRVLSSAKSVEISLLSFIYLILIIRFTIGSGCRPEPEDTLRKTYWFWHLIPILSPFQVKLQLHSFVIPFESLKHNFWNIFYTITTTIFWNISDPSCHQPITFKIIRKEIFTTLCESFHQRLFPLENLHSFFVQFSFFSFGWTFAAFLFWHCNPEKRSKEISSENEKIKD